MNENINLVEILKNAPKGTKLWSPLCGDCTLEGIGSAEGRAILLRARHWRKTEVNIMRYSPLMVQLILFMPIVSVCSSHPKRTVTGQLSKHQSNTSTLSLMKKYCAQ